MPGILDVLSNPSQYLQGILAGGNGPDYAALNPDAGDTEKLAKLLAVDPYAEADRKKKEAEAAAAAAKAAQSPFDAGAAGVPQAGISGQQAMNVGPFGALVPVHLPAAPVAPAVAPGSAAPALPQATEVKPAPAVRAAPTTTVDDTTLPANATPTVGAGTPPNIPETSLMGRMGQGLKDFSDNVGNHTSTLLALAGGLAGAPSFGTGLSRAFTSAAAALPMDQRIANQNLTVQALMRRGLPPDIAHAAATNPAIMQQLIPQVFGAKQFEFKTLKGPLGEETLIKVDPVSGKAFTLDGKPYNSGGGGATGMLAQGVEQYDPNLTGDAYLSQFSPDMKAAIKAWLNGDQMPTGNPRMQSIWNQAKIFAGNYANQMGIPFSDNLYAEKRKLRTDLASSGNSSMGGILANGESAFSHLAEAADSMADLGNTSHNFPLGGYAANAQNYIGNKLAGSAGRGKVLALNKNLEHYGQEAGKFYAGQGGSKDERLSAIKELNAESASSEEQAAFLEKEKSLMLDRLNGKFNQIRERLGEEEGNREIAQHMPTIQKNIDRIDQRITQLRGQNPTDDAQSTSASIPDGAMAALKTNPSLADQFDAKYGSGSAAKVLGH